LGIRLVQVKGQDPSCSGLRCTGLCAPGGDESRRHTDGYKGRFGWHNLRHSLATFFAANEVNLSVIQSILRHSKPSTTALYTHRVNSVQMAAQAKFLDAIKVTSIAV
jgi:integrase